ncbi:hypothetical protein PRZ48_000065 [Zasmidium cellare]|uniref:Amino acid permease/ SLC12A domain-containing protein n=1 Tax=Zasmidium cellare TaxID=395010 RepID=A0ABR0EYP7_ZASCE|nr:hypothetical protein PRZ48_000065 [Zasmidium cellare]
MSLAHETADINSGQWGPPDEKQHAHGLKEHLHGHQFSTEPDDVAVVHADENELHRSLKGRHMKMIAVGGAIGAGLFVGTAGAFQSGGPASVLLGFIIVGFMIYLMMQALAELCVMYPINGAFTMYAVRFIDPSWGFAVGWQYAVNWLTILPFEISAACNIIHYWQGSLDINDAAWICPLLFALICIHILKITACTGFILLAIIINCGGVPTDDRGYIGAAYWHSPYAAFLNGFKGFCGVFVTASFAYNGTELTGLAAAETKNPRKEIPRASKQVVFRIGLFYILTLFLIGICLPATSPLYAENATGGESRHSPFVLTIKAANIKVLPSIFNAVILISVMSVANSSTFGFTRTAQALAANGMGPKVFAYVDRKGRPLATTVAQLLFGCLAFINLAKKGGTVFNWLLALSGIGSFFVFGSIAVAHIRFRLAWSYNGHSKDEIPYKAALGVWGSYVCAILNFVCLMASFYNALYPVGGPTLNAENFFEGYLAAFFMLALYIGWKAYSWFAIPAHRPLYIKIKDIDIYSGMREEQRRIISGEDVPEETRRASVTEMQEEYKKDHSLKTLPMRVVRSLF